MAKTTPERIVDHKKIPILKQFTFSILKQVQLSEKISDIDNQSMKLFLFFFLKKIFNFTSSISENLIDNKYFIMIFKSVLLSASSVSSSVFS